MSDDYDIEIRNKESIFTETERNSDGSPVQEKVKDREVISEIRNKERIFTGATVNQNSLKGGPPAFEMLLTVVVPPTADTIASVEPPA